jgi:RND family efflux transporter MFP subunit
MFKKKTIIILILIVFGGYYFWFNRDVNRLSAEKITIGNIKESVTGNIKILARKTSNLKSNLPGIVKTVAKLPLNRSVSILKGHPIVKLDTSDLNRTLSQLITSKINLQKSINAGSIFKLELKIEEEELAAILKLSEGQHISSIDLKKKKAIINRLKTKVIQEDISNEEELSQLNFKILELETQMEKMTIRSPIDGELIHSFVSPGDLVSAGQLLATVISHDKIVEASLNEEDFKGLKEGLPAAVTLFSTGNKVIDGNVQRLASSVDSQTGRRLAYLEINAKTNSIPTGASGRVEIIIEKKINRLLVPKKALIGNSVFVVKNNKAYAREIEIGTENFNYVEVTKGLKEGEIVVTETPHLLHNSQKVEPVLPKMF